MDDWGVYLNIYTGRFAFMMLVNSSHSSFNPTLFFLDL